MSLLPAQDDSGKPLSFAPLVKVMRHSLFTPGNASDHPLALDHASRASTRRRADPDIGLTLHSCPLHAGLDGTRPTGGDPGVDVLAGPNTRDRYRDQEAMVVTVALSV